jgi:hypothetical protein
MAGASHGWFQHVSVMVISYIHIISYIYNTYIIYIYDIHIRCVIYILILYIVYVYIYIVSCGCCGKLNNEPLGFRKSSIPLAIR